MPHTSDAYRLNALAEYQAQLNAKLAMQHTQREGEVPINGSEGSFNINELLLKNILDSREFRDIMDFEALLDEIRKEVHNLEPLVVGSARNPSTAFCILYKLSRMRITFQELTWMLHSMDSPYIRGIAFLYIRFAMNPRDLWKHYAPYFDDGMIFVPFGDGVKCSIGKYVLGLIKNKRYQTYMLPPIPVTVKREWDVSIMKLDALESRQVKEALIRVGDSVMGFYGVDLKWYPAKVERILGPNSYLIIYDTYNNKEIRTRGHLLVDGEDPYTIFNSAGVKRERSRSPSSSSRRQRSRSRSRSHSSRRHSRSRSSSSEHSSRYDVNRIFDDKKLAEIAREKEREAAVTSGRVTNCVTHVKRSMMLKMDRFTNREQTRDPERNVVIRTMDVDDSISKAEQERERKKKEAEARKRLESIRSKYSKDTSRDIYNNDYV